MKNFIAFLIALIIPLALIVGGIYLSYRIGAATITRGINNATCHIQNT